MSKRIPESLPEWKRSDTPILEVLMKEAASGTGPVACFMEHVKNKRQIGSPTHFSLKQRLLFYRSHRVVLRQVFDKVPNNDFGLQKVIQVYEKARVVLKAHRSISNRRATLAELIEKDVRIKEAVECVLYAVFGDRIKYSNEFIESLREDEKKNYTAISKRI